MRGRIEHMTHSSTLAGWHLAASIAVDYTHSDPFALRVRVRVQP